MAGRLQNRIALITGSSSGLGRAMALLFAREGARVSLVDLYPSPRNPTDSTTGKADSFHHRRADRESTLAELQRLHGADAAQFVRADLTRPADVADAVAQTVARFGRLDVLCNNAGISVESTHARPHGVHETTEDDWDRTLAANAKSVFLGCKYGVAQMLTQAPLRPGSTSRGWIVNTASVQGLVAYHNTPAYCASKGAVVQLTKQVALDYAPHGIHCNAVCPGFLKTNMTQNLQNDPAKLAEIDRAHPLAGMGNPEDVARAALFLASDDAAWVTGVNLPVDGGYTTL